MADSSPRRKRPWCHPFSLLQRLAFCILVCYILICVFLFSIQNELTYPIKQSGAEFTSERAAVMARAMHLVAWNPNHTNDPQGYVRADFTNPAPRGTIVVFHGNGACAWNRTSYIDAMTPRGFRVFLYEYPGYGGRTGRPSEATIVPEAQALIRSLDQAGYGPIYVWGESLGAGVAAAVCKDTTLPVHGLVLLTPWDNIANVGLALYPFIPVRQLMIDKYDSIANLQQFAHPICVVRSANDEVIPSPLTLNLIAHLPDPKKVILQENCGHNDWPDAAELPWWDDALNFIAPKNP